MVSLAEELFYKNAQRAYDCIVKYAEICAASGVDMRCLNDLNIFASSILTIWGLDPQGNKYPMMMREFEDAYIQAWATGKSPELTNSEKRLILEGLSYYVSVLDGEGDFEAVKLGKFLAQRMKYEWETQKYDANTFDVTLPRTPEMKSLLSRLQTKTLDTAYFQAKDRVEECLRFLPDYVACLMAEGRRAEAAKAEILGYDMSSFWYDKADTMSSILPPDAFLDRIASRNWETHKLPTQSEMQMIKAGIQAHTTRMKSNLSAKARQTADMFESLSGEIVTELTKDSARLEIVKRVGQKKGAAKTNPERYTGI